MRTLPFLERSLTGRRSQRDMIDNSNENGAMRSGLGLLVSASPDVADDI